MDALVHEWIMTRNLANSQDFRPSVLEEILHARHPNIAFVYGVVDKTVQRSTGKRHRLECPLLQIIFTPWRGALIHIFECSQIYSF